jgi:hypothetical protein
MPTRYAITAQATEHPAGKYVHIDEYRALEGKSIERNAVVKGQANAWLAVCRLMDDIRHAWHRHRLNGQDAMLAELREVVALAERCEKAESDLKMVDERRHELAERCVKAEEERESMKIARDFWIEEAGKSKAQGIREGLLKVRGVVGPSVLAVSPQFLRDWIDFELKNDTSVTLSDGSMVSAEKDSAYAGGFHLIRTPAPVGDRFKGHYSLESWADLLKAPTDTGADYDTLRAFVARLKKSL